MLQQRVRRNDPNDDDNCNSDRGTDIYDAAAGGAVGDSVHGGASTVDEKVQLRREAGHHRRAVRPRRRAGHRGGHLRQRRGAERAQRRAVDRRIALRRPGGHHRRRYRRCIPLVRHLLGRRGLQPAGLYHRHGAGWSVRRRLPPLHVRQQETQLVLWLGHRHDH